MKFILKKKLITNFFAFFLKSNEILPIFDKKNLEKNVKKINKNQSLNDLNNETPHKSNHSANNEYHLQNTEKTNVISLGEKINYKESLSNFKESRGTLLDESPNSKLLYEFSFDFLLKIPFFMNFY